MIGRLSLYSHYRVCGEAASENDGFELAKQTRPHLAIVDISLRQGHGIELVKRIKTYLPKTKILVLSGYDASLYADRSIRAGAHGYLNKQQSNEQVIEAIETVLEGEIYVEDATENKAVRSVRSARGVQKLSDRELQVFALIGGGLTLRAIARHLHLSPHTIDTHRENIKRKLALQTSAALTQTAVEWRLQNSCA